MDLLSRIIRKAQKLGQPEAAVPAPQRNGVHAGGARAELELKPGLARTFFFVCGHPRSGTNWVSNLCNLHPDICCHGEFHFQVMYDAFDKFVERPWYVGSEAHIKPVAEQSLTQFVQTTLMAMADKRKPGSRIVGDHTPRVFQVLVRDASYIVVQRDGRDVVVSWTFHLLRTAKSEIVHEQARATFERELSMCGSDPDKLKIATRNLLQDQEWVTRLASGWSLQVQNDLPRIAAVQSSGGPTRVLVVRYEDLLNDVEGGRARMYEFLGARPDAAKPISSDSRTSPGFGREDPLSFYRKGEAGDWRNYFDTNTSAWFKACAGVQLIETGYEKDDRW